MIRVVIFHVGGDIQKRSLPLGKIVVHIMMIMMMMITFLQRMQQIWWSQRGRQGISHVDSTGRKTQELFGTNKEKDTVDAIDELSSWDLFLSS